MSTDIRAELSTKNQYWISKHRHYELKHFCLQYCEWKRMYTSLDGLSSHSIIVSRSGKNGSISDPTSQIAEARLYFRERMEMVEKAAKDAGGEIVGRLLLSSVTEELSYEHLRAQAGVPCCKDTWYVVYRRFFWMLDKARQ